MNLRGVLYQGLVEMAEFQRAVAHKIWISDLLNGSYTRGSEQFDIGYVEVLGLKIAKVNIIGSIVDKFSGENHTNAAIDDSSGTLRLRCWGVDSNLLDNINVGDLVLVVGKVKEYNNKIFVSPEIIKKLDDPIWLKVRRLELIKAYGETKQGGGSSGTVVIGNDSASDIVEERVIDGASLRGVVLSLIEKLDTGDGADVQEIVKRSGFDEASQVVEDLIRGGEVFELHKGRVRVMG